MTSGPATPAVQKSTTHHSTVYCSVEEQKIVHVQYSVVHCRVQHDGVTQEFCFSHAVLQYKYYCVVLQLYLTTLYLQLLNNYIVKSSEVHIQLQSKTLLATLHSGLRQEQCSRALPDSNIIIRAFSRPNESALIDSVKRPRPPFSGPPTTQTTSTLR